MEKFNKVSSIDETLNKKLSDLEPIEKSRGVFILERADIAKLVEKPLLPACEELYDKNIVTLGSSANKKDLEYGAYIIIDFDALSTKNQEIGKSLGEVYFTDDGNQLKITIPLTSDSTFGEVQVKAEEIVHMFIKQRYRVHMLTLESIRQ